MGKYFYELSLSSSGLPDWDVEDQMHRRGSQYNLPIQFFPFWLNLV
jgi:hypothetical protein